MNNELNDCVSYNGHRLTQLLITHPHGDHIEDIGSVTSQLPPYILQRQEYFWEGLKQSESDYENLDHYSTWQQTYHSPINPVPNWAC